LGERTQNRMERDGKSSYRGHARCPHRQELFKRLLNLTKQHPAVARVQAAWDLFVENKITSKANKVIGVTDTTYAQIHDLMAQGVKDESTHYEIGQQIESKLDELWEAGGETIARTEVNSAINVAMLEEARAMAPDLNKVWACAFLNSRQDHMDADGQSVPQSEPFIVGGEELMEPGDDSASDDQIVNCACTMFFEHPAEAQPGSEAPEEAIRDIDRD